jgi:hypothetical protein
MNLHIQKEMKKQYNVNPSVLSKCLYGLSIILLLFTACKKNEVQPSKDPVSVKEYYPNSGAQGTLVTVLGKGFGDKIDAVSATFSGKDAKVLSVTPDAITVQAPIGGQSGDLVIKINGETLSIGKYSYQELSVQKINPANGGAGTLMRITGAGFSSLSGPAKVFINDKEANVVSAKDTLLIIEVPVAVGSGPVKVVVNGKEASGQTFKFQSITAIKPLTGGKGTKVRVNGSGFETLAAGNYVDFNGKAALVQEVAEDHLIVVAPDGVATGPLSVTVNQQKVVGPVFTVVAVPVITNVTPLSGPAGAIMTISGTTFSAIMEENKVSINGVDVPITSASATKITLNIPGGTGSGKILLRVNDQLAQGPDFKDQTLGISKLSPENGLAGTRVTITGTGFNTTASQNQVTFNGTAAKVESATATSLIVIAPEGLTSGPLKITVAGITALAPKDFSRAGIITVAGGIGSPDLKLDNYNIGGLVADSKGNLFVMEPDYHRIKKITPDGKVTLFAGSPSGARGDSDGQGSAASFSFGFNMGISIDANDNLMVSDSKGIRKVTPQGLVSTFATGLGNSYKSTVSDGMLYVQRGGFSGYWKIDQNAVKTGFNTGGYSEDNRPVVIGNLLYHVNSNGGVIDIFNMTSQKTSSYWVTGLGDISALVDDSLGNIYVGGRTDHAIRKINIATKEVIIVAQFTQGSNVDGAFSDAKCGNISDMTIDRQGNVYFIDATNNAIRKIFFK